jgi:hypothetical protein
MSLPEILNCAKCGEIAMQALDVGMSGYGGVRWYFCHCFDGDCGNEGPRCTSSEDSIRFWNDDQLSQPTTER